ncbi:DUF3019 domain-containing protein [Neptunicella marina]|uniref:DUF3019 domain-containing protein n=1 Tax=Neptunicella marina TaxID=2125989 RepID=A0A8J6M3A9_9ALTE|nr:DUF3019 domain-containing protein [Neptunicella marina]MBC3765231.1 DUF3019 domain-containing protein [Neptunicella marina]
MKGIYLLLLLLVVPFQSFSEPNWKVLPNTCVVEKAGDWCVIPVKVKLSDLPTGEYCVMFEETPLGCTRAGEELTAQVRFQKPGQLTLLNQDKQPVLSTMLKIKTLMPQNQRRRVRSPWSIF